MCLVFFFCKHKTAYEMRISDWSSDVCSSDLRTCLERTSRRPFMRQWAFEWQKLQERTGVPRTEYPYYFDSFAEVRSGIIGQYIQGQGELYRSAYLRTLALAVERWRLPAGLAETHAMDVVPAVPGLFEIGRAHV